MAATYYRVRNKRGHNVAITALARKLVCLVWHILRNRQPYRYAPICRTREKLMKVRFDRVRSRSIPQILEAVYVEAGLPPNTTATPGEGRAVANNRRTITRLAKAPGKIKTTHKIPR